MFAIDNLSALGALDAIRARGLRVPDDMALAAFDDIPWFVHTDPPITATPSARASWGAPPCARWSTASRGGSPSPSPSPPVSSYAARAASRLHKPPLCSPP